MTDLTDGNWYETCTAVLAGHAINMLAGAPCCPHACLACEAVLTLHDRHVLDHVLLAYAETERLEWWDDATHTVRWDWVTDRWCTPGTCLPDELDETDETDQGGMTDGPLPTRPPR